MLCILDLHTLVLFVQDMTLNTKYACADIAPPPGGGGGGGGGSGGLSPGSILLIV